jgi:hypothetical protein
VVGRKVLKLSSAHLLVSAKQIIRAKGAWKICVGTAAKDDAH